MEAWEECEDIHREGGKRNSYRPEICWLLQTFSVDKLHYC